jgi:D-alanine-D-alanine ligase-like ATP-grasp enzyme
VAFLAEVGEVVVKPARGEQGNGITVGVPTPTSCAAVALADASAPTCCSRSASTGDDLRVVVIDHEVVAAAVRRPARWSAPASTRSGADRGRVRRRAAATGGESRIPLDEVTRRRTVADAGYAARRRPARGVELAVRRTANLHTGGTIHDVTDELHPDAGARPPCAPAEVLDIPVVGLDLLVPDVAGPTT